MGNGAKRYPKARDQTNPFLFDSYFSLIIDGKRIFQIQTYGGAGSTSSAKQIIQFDKDRAIELIRILSSEFGL